MQFKFVLFKAQLYNIHFSIALWIFSFLKFEFFWGRHEFFLNKNKLVFVP